MVPTPTSPESTGQGTTRTGQKSASTQYNDTIFRLWNVGGFGGQKHLEPSIQFN